MEKKKNNKIALVTILAVIILLAVLWLVMGGGKSKESQKAEPNVPTTPTLHIPEEEQGDEPYPYDDVSVLYGIWKLTDADYIKNGQEGHADFEKDNEYADLSEAYILFKEGYAAYFYDRIAKTIETLTYEAEMMKEFDGQVNVIVFEKVNTDTILRTFALDHQTKILTLVYEGEEGTADIYFKKISSSTDESVFQGYSLIRNGG